MSRAPQSLELEGMTVSCAPLPWEQAEDILPEVAQLITIVLEKLTATVATMPEAQQLKLMEQLKDLKHADVTALARVLAPVLSSAADRLGGGTLKRLAPLVLATTMVVYTDATGQKANASLLKKSDRADVFNEHPEAYFPILFFAGKVTFLRFFPGSALAASPIKQA